MISQDNVSHSKGCFSVGNFSNSLYIRSIREVMMDEGFAVHILGKVTNETFDIPLTINGERWTLILGEEKIRKSINEDAITKPQEFNNIEREGNGF